MCIKLAAFCSPVKSEPLQLFKRMQNTWVMSQTHSKYKGAVQRATSVHLFPIFIQPCEIAQATWRPDFSLLGLLPF